MTVLRLIPPPAAVRTGSQVRYVNTAHGHQSVEILVIRADISHAAIFQCFYPILNCSVFPPSLPFHSGFDGFKQMLAFGCVQRDGNAVKRGKGKRPSWWSRMSTRSVGRKVGEMFLHIFHSVHTHTSVQIDFA